MYVTEAQLAASDGSSLVGFLQSGTDAVALTVEAKLRQALDAEDYGADPTGTNDSSDALVNLLAEMQASGKPGRIREGRYLVDRGALVWTFANSGDDIAGPRLETVGRVTLVANTGSPDAPFFSIHNDASQEPGDPGYPGNHVVLGGFVGDLTFEDTTNDGSIGAHGLMLYGVEFMRFGVMQSVGAGVSHIQGDVIHLEQHGDFQTADAFHVYGCYFEGAKCFYGDGWAFHNNLVGQTFNGCYIKNAWGTANGKGIYKGAGSNIVIADVSCFRCGSAFTGNEAALDLTSNNGTVENVQVLAGEIDSPYGVGIRCVGIIAPQINARITYRRESGVTYPSRGMIWEDLEAAIGTAGGPQGVVNGRFFLNHRIDPTVTLNSDIDSFLSRIDSDNDAPFGDNVVTHRYNASYTPSSGKFADNITGASAFYAFNDITVNGATIHYRSRATNDFVGRFDSGGLPDSATATTLVSSTARLGVAGTTIVLSDTAAAVFAAGVYTAPASANADIALWVTVAADADGDEIELAFTTTAGAILYSASFRAKDTGPQTYRLAFPATLARGTAYQFTGRHSGSGTASFTAGTGGTLTSANGFSVTYR